MTCRYWTLQAALVMALALPVAAQREVIPGSGTASVHEERQKTFEQVLASMPESMPPAARQAMKGLFTPTRGASSTEGIAELQGKAQAAAAEFLIEQLDIAPSALAHAHMMHVLPDIPSIRAEHGLQAMGDAARPYLISALQHDSTNIRANVAAFLGRWKSPEVIEALTKSMGDQSPLVVLATASSLVRMKAQVSPKPILKLLEHEQASIRGQAVDLLGAIAERRDSDIIDAISARLKDTELRVRYQAAYALGNIGSPRAVQDLLAHIHADDDKLRLSVIENVGKIGDLAATVPLLRQYERTEDRTEQWAILDALQKLRDPRAVPMLIDLLSAKNDYSRVGAARALGAIGSRAEVPALIDALDGEDVNVVLSCVEALGQIGDPRATDVLIVLLEHDNLRLATTATVALGAINDPKAVSPLVKALYRPDAGYSYYERVAEALVAIKDPAVVPALINGLRQEPNYARLTAYRTLNRLTGESYSDHDPRTFDRWKQWMKDHAELLGYDKKDAVSADDVLKSYTQRVHAEVLPRANELRHEEIVQLAGKIAAEVLAPHKDLLFAKAKAELFELPKLTVDLSNGWETVAEAEGGVIASGFGPELSRSTSQPGTTEPVNKDAILLLYFWNAKSAAYTIRTQMLVRHSGPQEYGQRAMIEALARPLVSAVNADPQAPAIAIQTGADVFVVSLKHTDKGYYVDDKVQWLRRTASLQAVTYVDMFARNYMTQRPLLCGKDRYYPLGTDMVFKHSETRDEFHVVFPKGVALPGKSELSDPLTLYGHFETIKTTPDGEALDEPAKPAKGSLLGYRYFVVSRWELHK